MARVETYGTRNMAWSIFHRSMPRPAYMIDLDYIEACPYCKRTLILGEIAVDVGQTFKPTTILKSLAKQANVDALLIFIKADVIDSAVRLITGQDLISDIRLTALQLATLWEHIKKINEPILRITYQNYARINTHKLPYKCSGAQFFEFLSTEHLEHEKECGVCLRIKRYQDRV